MTDQNGTQAAAGWYPQDDGTQRYWDGARWTEHSAPGAGATVGYGAAPPGGTPQKSSSTAKILIPIGACVALAVVAVVIAALAGGDNEDGEAARVTTSTEASTTSAEGQGEAETTEAPTTTTAPEETTTTAPPAPDGSQDSPLALGTGTRVGDYEVTLVSVDLEATDAVMAENQFNEPPPTAPMPSSHSTSPTWGTKRASPASTSPRCSKAATDASTLTPSAARSPPDPLMHRP